MESSRDWTICADSVSNDALFLVPDSLSHEANLTSSSTRELPELQNLFQPRSPELFGCIEEDCVASMASDKISKNPFAVESEMETDGAEALVADTTSDNSGNSSRDESDKNVTVIQRISPEETSTSRRPTSTPAQTLSCLQLSGNPMLVPETMESLDAVPPTLDAFDPHPTMVPDSPSEDSDRAQDIQQPVAVERNEEEEDEDDGVVSFKPVMPTMDKDEDGVTQGETQQSLGVIGSQNFHLRFSPSQAISVSDEREKGCADDDFSLKIAEVMAPGEQSQAPVIVIGSQDESPLAENTRASKPSFCLQKPDTCENATPPEEETEGSVSVFKRIKSGVRSPLRLKRVSDDSEEMNITKSVSGTDKSRHQIFELGKSFSSKMDPSSFSTADKSTTGKKVNMTGKSIEGSTKGKGSVSSSGLHHIENAGQKPLGKSASNKADMEIEKGDQAHGVLVAESVDNLCEDLDDTISYSYTETKNLGTIASVSDKAQKMDQSGNSPEMVPDKEFDSSSDNFILSQKRMVPKVSERRESSEEDFRGFGPPENEDIPMPAVKDVIKDKECQAASDLQNPHQELASLQESKKGNTEEENASAHNKILRRSKISEEEDYNAIDAKGKAGSFVTDHHLLSEGSTLAQSTSLDPYTFRDSQSQTFATGPTMPLSDKPFISARVKKAAVVKTMRKVLRKKQPCQQIGDKSSSSDVSHSEASKLRQGHRKKGSVQRSASPVDVVAQPTVQSVPEEAQAGFTMLQNREQFSRPQDPPPSKTNVKHVSETGTVSSHLDPHDTRKESHSDLGDGQRRAKKNTSVSFSTNAATSRNEMPDSPDQEIERTTIQEIVTSEVVISRKIVREVINSKGQCLHKSETSEVVRKIKFEPVVTQLDVTEKVSTAGHGISPSRSTSTVTTGDLADISSSSLSRVFSSGSKTSLEVLPSSQSLPTPAQRQRSTEKTDAIESLSHASLKSGTLHVPSSIPVCAPPAPSKSDSKRSSAGSNTGQDLFGTPNQSIINPIDSQLGMVLSSSASSTPDDRSAKTTITSPPQGLTAPRTSDAIAHKEFTSNASLHVGTASSSPCPPPMLNPTPSPSLSSFRAISKRQPSTSSATRSKSPGKVFVREQQSEGQQNKKDTSNISALNERGERTPEKMGTERNVSVTPQAVPLTSSTSRLGSRRGKKQASSLSSKEDVGESTDLQSTGFSVHGVPPSTASGNSGKDLVGDVSTKVDSSVSAQISLQGRIIKDMFTPYILTDYKSKPTLGAKVMGRWKDGFYYPGSLSRIEPGKRAMVQFDDGSQRWVRPHEIILASDLPVGQSVMVLSEGDDGFYLPGMVMGHCELPSETKSEELFYQVERDDGVNQKCKRSSLILSEDQALCLLSDDELKFSADAVTPSTGKPGDISLDNLVEGKRHLRSVQQPVASTSKSAAPSSPPSATATDMDGASICRSGRKRRMGPLAISTPTPKHARHGKKDTPVKGNRGSVLGSVMSSPMESRKSPRKIKMDLFSSGLLSNPHLFEGIVFMLTHAEKSPKWRAYEKQLLHYSSLDTSVDDSTDIEPDVPPYNKEQLHLLIQQHGGKIVTSLDAQTITSARQCFLVAAEHQRTVKYMQALAAGVTVISHQWVLVSVKEEQLQGLKAYTLPAGISYDNRKLMEGSKGCPELSRQVIMVVSNTEDFVEAWTSILSLTGCQLATKFPARASKNDPGVDVVVSDESCPASLVKRCNQLNVPLVSSEWVAQCLINGRMVDFKGHQKYKHDFMESEAAATDP